MNLNRELSLTHAVALVVGSIIGTGIFLKTAIMAETLGFAPAILWAWILAGLLSWAGALTYSELAALFPKVGGEYVYLRQAYGNLPGFLFGWMRYWIASPGSIAAYAVGAASFFAGLVDVPHPAMRTWLAIGTIVFFTVLNCFSVGFGGRVQTVLTILKTLLILFVVGGILLLAPGSWTNLQLGESLNPSAAWPSWSAFGGAMIAALWAYDGWNNLPMVAGEVRNARRNVPLALTWGVGAIILIYVITNVAYLFGLPFTEIVSAYSKTHPEGIPVATKAASLFLGAAGVGVVSVTMVLSALGAMNGSVLAGARVPFAMAQDGLFFRPLAYVSKKNQVPLVSVLTQGVWACVLAASGTFDQLTDYVVFSSWIFYVLCGIAVFIFRRRQPQVERTFRVWGYPWVPAIFIICSILLLLNTLFTSPRESFIGLGIILAGVPVYLYVSKKYRQ